MTMRKALIAALCFLFASPALAANVKPQVNYTGILQPMKAGDTLVDGSGTAFQSGPVGTIANPTCFTVNTPCLWHGSGAPASTAYGKGSLYLDETNAYLYEQLIAGGNPTPVQQKSFTGSSVTLSSAPVNTHLLLAACWGYPSVPSAGSGWSDTGVSHAISVLEPGDHWYWKTAGVSESTTQTPCSGGARSGGSFFEVISGDGTFTPTYESNAFGGNTFGGTSITLTYTTANANDLVLGSWAAQGSGGIGFDPGAGTATGLAGSNSTAHGGQVGVVSDTKVYASSSSSVSATGSFGSGVVSGRIVILKPVAATDLRFSFFTTIKNGGTNLDTNVYSLNCSTGVTCTTDGAGHVDLVGNLGTVTHTGSALTLNRLVVGNGGADTTIGLTDVTTDNVTISAHGLVPKAPNDATKCLVGDATWLTCPGSGAGTVTTTGSPASGNLTKFSGATSVTNTTLSAILDAEQCSTRGSILYRGASGWVCLAPSTSGYSLTTQGAGADPSWTNVGGGGGGGVTQVNTEAGWTSGGPITTTGQVTVSNFVKAMAASTVMSHFGGL